MRTTLYGERPMTPNERAAMLALVSLHMSRGHTDACKLLRAEDGYRRGYGSSNCICGFSNFEDRTYDLRMEDDYNA